MHKVYSIHAIKMAKETGAIKNVLFTRNSDISKPKILKEVQEALSEIDDAN